MSNWTTNTLAAKTPEGFKPDEFNNINANFSALIPQPKSLDIESSRTADTIHQKLFPAGRLRNEFAHLAHLVENPGGITEKNTEEINQTLAEEFSKKDCVTAFFYQHNLNHHGYKTWYQWSRANWGTKWNACHTKADTNNLEITFDTAWTAPIPYFRALAKKLAGTPVTMTCQYEGEPQTIIWQLEDFLEEPPAPQDSEKPPALPPAQAK